MTHLLELGRSGHREQLEEQARLLREQGSWTPLQALELACAWLLLGDRRSADLAYLEADQLDPSLALVPDVWGLWPAPEAQPSSWREQALQLAKQVHAWRRPDPAALWRQLLPELQADWRRLADPPHCDAFLLLGLAVSPSQAPELDPPLEPLLAQLVADAEIGAEPAASCRFWQLVARAFPQWAHARIRAADLALARGDLERCSRWLSDPPAEALARPWFHDVAARQALQRGAVEEALKAWQEAIRTADADPADRHHVPVFEQRRRDARRGPGVLQVRSLANGGDHEAARALLERLLAEDPQWQPLQALREQVQDRRPVTGPNPVPLPDAGIAAPSGEVESSSRFLDQALLRFRRLGGTPPTCAQAAEAASTDAAAADLEAFSRRLSDWEARYALA